MMKRKCSVLLAIFFILFKGAYAQNTTATISGIIKNNSDKAVVAYANIVLKKEKDSAFVSGTVSAEDGRFSLAGIKRAIIFSNSLTRDFTLTPSQRWWVR